VLTRLGVEVLVDVRSRPFSRNREFNRPALAAWFQGTGTDYLWRGDILGGFAPIEEEAIKWLAQLCREHIVCIMCMEADPEKCHRKAEIGWRTEAYGVCIEHVGTEP
jgi:uncharacterized protein (DUF488 family)